jgi:predicted PurR-regulated permease PerM
MEENPGGAEQAERPGRTETQPNGHRGAAVPDAPPQSPDSAPTGQLPRSDEEPDGQEPSPEADEEKEEAAADRKLLLDREARVEAVDGDGEFGEPGPRFNRRSPFWIGMMGGLGVGAAFVLGWSIVNAREILLLIALALFIAIGLEPVVALLHRHRVPRPLAVALVSLAGLGIVAGVLALAIPPLVTEVDKLVNLAPHYVQTLNNRSSFLGHLNNQYHIVSHLKKALSSGGASSVASGVVGAGTLVVGAITGVLIVVILTIYFLADMPRVTRTLYRLVPHSRRARAGLLIDEMFARVGGYVLGNVITSVIAALGTLIWLAIWGVPYPLLLSVFVGLMDLIPIVGSTVAGIIVSLVALTVSWPVALATAAFYIVYRNLEDYLITPRVMERTVKVSGLVTVIAVLIGGTLLGIIGALIAIPVAAAINLVVEEVSYPRLDSS